MKKFSKYLLVLVSLIALGVGLAACGGDPVDMEEVKQELIDHYKDTIGKSTYVVTDDVELISTIESIKGLTITWVSADTNFVANDGSIVRFPTVAEGNKKIAVEATLKVGKEEIKYTFYFSLNPEIDLDAAKAALIAHYKDTIGSSSYTVTEDVELVTTIEGISVTWVSSNTDLVAHDGSIVRFPSHEEGNTNVGVEATIKAGTLEVKQMFYFYLEALEKTDAEKANEALTKATAFPASYETDGVIGNIEMFPTTTDLDGAVYEVVWTSNNAAIAVASTITKNADDIDVYVGTVTRGPLETPDVVVQLTATITINDVEFKKTVNVKVLSLMKSIPVDTIAEMFTHVGEYVKLQGVTVFGMIAGGYFVTDGVHTTYVFDSTIRNLIKVGNVYDFEGVVAHYYGGGQLAAAEGSPITAVASTVGAKGVDYIEKSLGNIIEDTTPPSDTNLWNHYPSYRITAKVHVETDPISENYDTYLVPVDFTGTTVFKGTSKADKTYEYVTNDILQVYYQSNKEAIKVFDGKVITIDFLLYGFRSDYKLFYGQFFGTEADVIVEGLTDAEKMVIAKSQANSIFSPGYPTATTVELPQSVQGVNFAYETSHPDLFDVATGKFTLPTSGIQEVTITMTLTVGSLTETVVVSTMVGELSVEDIVDARVKPDGSVVLIEGIFTGNAAANYYINDGTAAINVRYLTDKIADLEIGDKVKVEGEIDIYNAQVQLTNLASAVVVSKGNALPEPLTLTIDEVVTTLQGQRVSITNLTATNYVTSSRTLFLTDGTKEIGIRVESSSDTAGIAYLQTFVGKQVDVIGAHVSQFNTTMQLTYSGESNLRVAEMNETQKVNSVIAGIEIPTKITENMTLTLPATGDYDTVITWESDHASVNATSGAVVVPTTEIVNVKLTVTVTLGETTQTKDFMIEVGAVSVMTVAEALEVATGGFILTEGVLTGYVNNNTYTLQDDTAAISIYVENAPEAVKTFLAGNIGKEIKVTGTKGAFNGLLQVNATNAVLIGAGELPTAVSLDEGLLDAATLLPHQNKLVSITQVTISNYAKDSHGNVSFTLTTAGSKTIGFRWDSRVSTIPEAAKTFLNGTGNGVTVDLTNVSIGWYNNPQLLPTQSMTIAESVLTDAQKVALDHAALSIELNVLGAGDMGLPLTGTNGSVIAWESDNLDVITNDGVVTLAAEQTTVKMTATLTIGTESLTKEFNVVVPAEGAAVEAVIYETGFEASEGFVGSTTYNNADEKLFGPEGKKWGIVSGTASTTDPISGGMSLQTRDYNNMTVAPTITTKFTVTDVTKVEFYAKNTEDVKVKVSYSLDGTTWLNEETFDLTTTKTLYTYVLNSGAAVEGNVYIRFVSDNNGTENDKERLYIDDVKIYGMVAPG